MLRALVVAVAVLGIGACHAGLSAERFIAMSGPEGIQVNLELRRGRLPGELLEVQDTALLVLRLNAEQVMLVPLREIRTAVYKKRGMFIYRGAFVDEARAAEARLLSRYPTGLTPALRGALLASYGQTQPIVAQ
jgi:hypothetical protein